MNQAIRCVRTHNPSASIILSSPSFDQVVARRSSAVKFRKFVALSGNNPDSQNNMDKTQNPDEKTGDVMSHSFGEGYATRSDEEGFGGIYGGNQTKLKVDIDKEIHENHPAYDKSQGSEVKEKEKARHQSNIASN